LAILHLNFDLKPVYNSIKEAMDSLIESITNGIIVRKDEIIFFQKILSELRSESKLPFINVLEILDNLNKLLNIKTNTEVFMKVKPVLTDFLNNMYIHSKDMMSELGENCNYILEVENDIPVIFKITFNKKPFISTIELLNSISDISYKKAEIKAELLRCETGSYIEIISTGIISIFAFQIAVYGLNGCLLQFKDTRDILKLIKNKDISEDEGNKLMENVLARREKSYKHIFESFGKVLSIPGMISSLSNFTNKGFSKENIQKAEISN
jgi:hypothetical protein